MLYNELIRILTISKTERVDLKVAYLKALNENRVKGIKNNDALDMADEISYIYYEEIAKLWNENNLQTIEKLCSLFEKNDTKAIEELLKEWR